MNRFRFEEDGVTYLRVVTRDYALHHGLKINEKYSVVDSDPTPGWDWVVADLPGWWDEEMARGGETFDVG